MGQAHAAAACILVLFAVHVFAPPTDPQNLQQPCTKQSSSSVEMYQMHVRTNVRNRFAHTTVTTKVMNCGRGSNETTFSMVLPKTAFISGFVMEINGRNYTAYVKEKDGAKQIYSKAVSSGLGAGHVAVGVRDSNQITVSVNVEPRTVAAFYLTYEELLTRRNGLYEVVINLHPGQLVPDLSVVVDIAEDRKIENLHVPQLRSGNEIELHQYHSVMPFLKTIGDTTARVGFSPNLEKQKTLASDFGRWEDDGLACQFVVAYDVERDPKGGEVLVEDGYFVHFFAPSNLKRLPKLVVFVLDTSYSMKSRNKIYQLQTAMYKILDDLQPDDAFHLVEFNTHTNVWVLENSLRSIKYTTDDIGNLMTNYQQHGAYSGNPDNINKAKDAVSRFKPTGWTDIYKALRISISLVQLSKMLSTIGTSHQPMIIFLTDGDPTVGETSKSKIIKEITKFNTGLRKTPIFTLSFGDNTDRRFLETLALSNSAFPKHIYEAADASLQLQNFYTEISSPLLADVVFKYLSSSTNLTETKFPLHFRGAELVTAGRYDLNERGSKSPRSLVVNAWNGEDDVSFIPAVRQSSSSVERLWAYLTVKQLLEKLSNPEVDQEEIKQKAIELSLKYSFVTPVTSLVVVKPNSTDPAIIADANEPLEARVEDPLEEQIPSRPEIMEADRDVQDLAVSQSNQMSFTERPPQYGNTGGSVDLQQVSQVEGMSISCANQCKSENTDTCYSYSCVELPKVLYDLEEDGWLNLPTGRYKVGSNETRREARACSNSFLNSHGNCKLLHLCVDKSMALRIDDYLDHFCVVKNEYAGICCPDGWLSEN